MILTVNGSRAATAKGRQTGRRQASVVFTVVLRAAISILGAVVATIPTRAVDLDDLTLVTLARDGSWGVARAGSQGQAIAAAIRDCRAMAAAPNDCGAQSTTTRGDWVIANLCGDHKIIVAAKTREAAEQAALMRETDLKRLHAPGLPPCTRVLTVDPGGAVQAAGVRPADAREQLSRQETAALATVSQWAAPEGSASPRREPVSAAKLSTLIADPAVRGFVGLAENAWDFSVSNGVSGSARCPRPADTALLSADRNNGGPPRPLLALSCRILAVRTAAAVGGRPDEASRRAQDRS
jgi:hypothetical protein